MTCHLLRPASTSIQVEEKLITSRMCLQRVICHTRPSISRLVWCLCHISVSESLTIYAALAMTEHTSLVLLGLPDTAEEGQGEYVFRSRPQLVC